MRRIQLNKIMNLGLSCALFLSMILSATSPKLVHAAPKNNELLPLETVPQSTYDSVYSGSQSKIPRSYLVKFKDNVDSQLFLESKKISKSKKKKFFSSNSMNLDLTESEFAELRNDTNVLQIESDAQVAIASIGMVQSSSDSVKKMKVDDETVPWGIKAVGADLTNNQNINGKTIKIGVLDTGVSNHPDLKLAGGVSFVESSKGYIDDNGHGTHVAGTIAALDNRIGVIGMAPKVELYAIKVLGADGSGSYSQVVQGIEWAIANKMDIINLSFGGTENSEILHTAIKEAVKAGLIVVAAAGNQGQATESELYPALFSEVVSVGATTTTNQRATYSSTGSNLSIVAPGSEILSTTMDGKYGMLSGTSMAAPHVTGAAALAWSKNKKLKNEDVKKILYDTATPLGSTIEYGKGLLNVAKALGLTDKPIPPIEVEDNPPTNSSNPPQTFNIIEQDDKLAILSEKLLNLKAMSISMKKTEIAKEASSLYNNLRLKSTKLHNSVKSTKGSTKEQVRQNVIAKNIIYQVLAPEFQKLQWDYIQGINTLIRKMNASLTGQSDNSIVSSNKIGNESHIHAGDTKTVGITLDKPIPIINVEIKQNDTILFTESFLPNDSLHPQYTWKTNAATLPGDYSIVFHYPDAPGWEDTFTVHVSDSETKQSVTSAATVTTLTLNTGINVDIPEGDYRIYKFTPSATNYYQIFTGQYNGTGGDSDTVLEIYSDAGLTNLIAENDDGSNIPAPFSELELPLTGAVSYYIKLKGYVDQSVHTRITARISPAAQAIPTITSYVDISAPAGPNKIYKYIPSTSGAYKISTSYYAGSTAQGINDTVLYIYTDPYLTNMIDYGDDTDGSVFATLNVNMAKGSVYFIEIGNLVGDPLKTRLSIASGAGAATTITLGVPVAVSTAVGIARIFKFTPTVTRVYHLYTDYYNDNAESNDTKLEVFADAGLTIPVPYGYNDNSNGTSFSHLFAQLTAQTSYYIKLSGADGGKVLAKMYVENGDYPTQGHNDSPSPGQTLSGIVNGWGWVIDGSITKKVEILIDNVVQTQAVYGDSREDVYNAYPLYNNHFSGYHFTLNTAVFTSGMHNFKVRETDNNGALSIIANYNVNIQNDTIAPSAPANLTGTIVNNNQVQLNWSPATDNVGITGYRVYNGAALLTTVAATTFTTAALPVGQNYTFTVVAIDAAGNSSAASNAVSITLADTTPPTTPSNLTILSKTPTSVALSWSASTDNSGSLVYDVYSNGIVVGTVSGTSFTVQGLVSGTNYSLYVKARDASGNVSAASNEIFLGYRILTYYYNAANRIDYIQMSSGQKYKYNYDSNGNLLSVVKVN